MEFGLSSPAEILTFLNAGGVLAILVLIIWSGRRGWWVWGQALEREISRADKAEAETVRLHVVVEEKVIPAMDASNHYLTEARSAIERMTRENERLSREIAELKGSRG